MDYDKFRETIKAELAEVHKMRARLTVDLLLDAVAQEQPQKNKQPPPTKTEETD